MRRPARAMSSRRGLLPPGLNVREDRRGIRTTLPRVPRGTVRHGVQSASRSRDWTRSARRGEWTTSRSTPSMTSGWRVYHATVERATHWLLRAERVTMTPMETATRISFTAPRCGSARSPGPASPGPRPLTGAPGPRTAGVTFEHKSTDAVFALYELHSHPRLRIARAREDEEQSLSFVSVV